MQNDSELILYSTDDGGSRIDVRLLDETVWLTQAQMVDLFQKSKATINEHIKNVFREGELDESAVVRNFRITAADGKEYDVMHYNLDVIISVGYRVRSQQGTRFRQWATARLREYLVKGFTLDDDRLKERRTSDAYFEELLQRIREIRTSEINFYKKVTQIYATSDDYNPNTELSQQFFATVQNKLHFAVTGHTAAELVADRADANKPNMGLTTFSGKSVAKKDVTVAKNYLDQEEAERLLLLVDQYLSYAEFQAKNRRIMYMQDWAAKLDQFLEFNEQELLKGVGRVSRPDAEAKAHREYDLYKKRLAGQTEDDYDRFLQQTSKLLPGSKSKSPQRKKTK